MGKMTRVTTLLLGVALTSVACSSSTAPGDDNGGDPIDPTGNYALVSVGGAALPIVVETDDGDFEIIAGQFTVSAGGGCAGAVEIREVGAEETEVMGNSCTWTLTGNQLEVVWSDGATDTATLQNGTLSLVAQDLGGLELVFQK